MKARALVLEVWCEHFAGEVHYYPAYDEDAVVACDEREFAFEKFAESHLFHFSVNH